MWRKIFRAFSIDAKTYYCDTDMNSDETQPPHGIDSDDVYATMKEYEGKHILGAVWDSV